MWVRDIYKTFNPDTPDEVRTSRVSFTIGKATSSRSWAPTDQENRRADAVAAFALDSGEFSWLETTSRDGLNTSVPLHRTCLSEPVHQLCTRHVDCREPGIAACAAGSADWLGGPVRIMENSSANRELNMGRDRLGNVIRLLSGHGRHSRY
jgi:hypothetical protein